MSSPNCSFERFTYKKTEVQVIIRNNAANYTIVGYCNNPSEFASAVKEHCRTNHHVSDLVIEGNYNASVINRKTNQRELFYCLPPHYLIGKTVNFT